MKTNILIFSTRLIGEVGTILEMTKPVGHLSSKIAGYFLDVSQEDLKKYLPKETSCNISMNDFHEKVKELSSEFFYKNNNYLKKLGKDQKDDAKRILLDLMKEKPNPELEKYLKGLNLTGEPSYPDFTEEHFKDESILDKPAVNINLDKGKTMRDRVTLYTLVDEGKDSDERTVVYAVWPLGVSGEGEKEHKWVDCLTDAAINESELEPANARESELEPATRIILLLHDHDLKSTQKTPFKTLYPFQEYKGLQRALAVFQHSNSFFREIIKPCDEGAKAVFEKAKKIVEDDVIFSHLKKLSDNIAKYNSEKDNINLENVLKELGKYKIIFSEFPDGEVGPGKIGEESLLAANAEVNAQIKKLRTKEVEK
ncbi:MAG: hypothetical protein J6X88_10515 [Bacteroidales bacterium]|nr:hypothetical protein [Bacteroidales bacterium]